MKRFARNVNPSAACPTCHLSSLIQKVKHMFLSTAATNGLDVKEIFTQSFIQDNSLIKIWV